MTLSFLEPTIYKPQSVRGYQDEGIEASRTAWRASIRALTAVATGGGKTTMIAELLRREFDPHQHRALIIAHTEEIITQIRDRVANQFGGALESRYGERASKGIGIVMAEQDDYDARIVVATRQSLSASRLSRLLLAGKIDFVIIDEAHHAAPGTTYMEIWEAIKRHNPEVKLAGFTATPKRADDLALGAMWDQIVYQWSIEDGIKAGYLVPPVRIGFHTNVSTSAIKSTGGDYSAAGLVSVLEVANWAELAARAYLEYILPTERLALAFFPAVQMSLDFAAILRAQGVEAAHIDGETDKDVRRRILREYTSGRVRVISNMGVLTEGFDAPETGAILMARPTRSPTLFTQIIGRGLRPFPDKDHCLIVDLAVTDVKALKTGDLIGRMIHCKGCGIEHYAGLKACPKCGFVRPAPERLKDGAGVEEWENVEWGEGLIATTESVFEKAFAAWHKGADGYYSCPLSFEVGALVIEPPGEDDYYRLFLVPHDFKKPARLLEQNEDLPALMLAGDERVIAHGAHGVGKQAAWRTRPPTPNQANALAKIGVDVTDDMTGGKAGELLTHYYGVERVGRWRRGWQDKRDKA